LRRVVGRECQPRKFGQEIGQEIWPRNLDGEVDYGWRRAFAMDERSFQRRAGDRELGHADRSHPVRSNSVRQ
jgi:hypothetical protein